MPLGFPSHQGLIAPLWRRWPNAFDAPAMCVGAALPDLVDAVGAVSRGHFAQGIGHSLLGLAVFGIPAGLGLWLFLHAAARTLRPVSDGHFSGRAWNLGLSAVANGITPARFPREWPRVLWSMVVGGVSHLLFDLISHGGFPWLMPWLPKIRIYPEWWYATWARIPISGCKEPFAIGPYSTIWLLLSIIGAYLLFRPAFRKP